MTVFPFAGWGNLVFFDTKEHQIPNNLMTLAEIPKLGNQWRVIHDFKPTEYLQAENPPTTATLSLRVVFMGDNKTIIAIEFPFPKIGLAHAFHDENMERRTEYAVTSTQLPKVGEWTRMEIGHEKVDGKFFLSLSVGGMEVGRKEVDDPGLRKPTDVKVRIGSLTQRIQPGFIRRLVVLEK